MAVRARHGVHAELEAEADQLLYDSLHGVTSRLAKSDILTPWKDKHRRNHEIMTKTGAPVDGAVRRGMFNRAYNPRQTHLNSYDGPTRPVRMNAHWDPDSAEPVPSLSPQMAQVVGIVRAD